MLANILAVLLGLGSFTFYIAAFFYPEVHRRSDILWSGLGLFYAAVLWFSSGQMTGVVLLGQFTAVALLLGLGWQTLSIRRVKTPVYQQTPVVVTPEVVGTWAKNTVNKLRIAPEASVPLKLEKRSFKEFSAERIDPRRRPTYDYEFVEDGIGEQFPRSPVLDPQELALEPTVDMVPEVDYAAPPSAEGEVIRVDASEVAVEPEAAVSDVGLETLKAEALEAADSEMGEAEEIEGESLAVEALDESAQGPEADSIELAVVVDDVELLDEGAAAVIGSDVQIAQQPESESDWGDFDDVIDDVDTPSVSAGEREAIAPEPTVLAKSKPSLIAMPLVLVGWVKDVVGSFAKPKPSKPVIVIPRREPSIKVERPAENDAKPYGVTGSEEPRWSDRAASPPERPAPDSNWNDSSDEFPEDSNWDD